MSEFKICFIIANKYIRGYSTHIKTYVENINTFYKDCFVLIVDNNSNHFKEDITFDYENVLVITNTSECKFELGAYKFGISYLLENKLLNSYEYFVFTQDTFVLTNYYDFNNLLENNIIACPLVGSSEGFFSVDYNCGIGYYRDHKDYSLIKDCISNLNLTHCVDKLSFCFSSSFVLNSSKLIEFLDFTKSINTNCKMHSECTEAYFSWYIICLE